MALWRSPQTSFYEEISFPNLSHSQQTHQAFVCALLNWNCGGKTTAVPPRQCWNNFVVNGVVEGCFFPSIWCHILWFDFDLFQAVLGINSCSIVENQICITLYYKCFCRAFISKYILESFGGNYNICNNIKDVPHLAPFLQGNLHNSVKHRQLCWFCLWKFLYVNFNEGCVTLASSNYFIIIANVFVA